MWGHLAFAAVAVLAIPAIVAFCWHPVVATVGDDSVSYLLLARHFTSWHPDPLAAPWTGYFSNFPPLFPLLLAVTGGAYDLFIAHLVVAAAAVVALVLGYAYARARLGSDKAALAVTVLFLLLPGMWLGLAGILSESTYLAVSLAALLYEAKRVGPESPARAQAVLGLLLAAAVLSRTVGFALLAAYAARLAIEAVRGRRFASSRRWIPVAIALAAQLAWLAVRPPLASPAYQSSMGLLLREWSAQPVATLVESWGYLSRGWIGVFAIDAAGGAAAAVAAGIVALLAFAGAVRAALRGRLDGWYVLASIAMLLAWKFNEDNSRRLLYPLLPLVLVHAAEAVRAVAAKLPARAGRWIPAAAALFLAAMVLPASALVLRKSLDRAPYYPGLGYSPASMKDYYGTVDAKEAGEQALRGASVLAGMSRLGEWTVPGARVMWMRPEYVAVLGGREGVPLYFRWDRATLAREILRTRTDYVIASRHFKNDLATYSTDAFLWLALDPPDYLVPVHVLPDPERSDFALLAVDAARLQRYVRETEGAPPGPPGPRPEAVR